jgi:hypothetical protein
MIPELGTLQEVDLRLAWDHEARGLTPWLAQHLDVIAKEIGIPLELEGVEVAVGSFWADILARTPQDDLLVLIENQLEVTNHDHLGKIMTYLAGLEAKIIIWIARDFREEHRSAVRWLNDHTADPFAFFAVRVKVVQIGDSPLAPVFEVLERPNEWDRRLQEVVRETQELSDRGRFRLDFWSHYLTRHPDEEKYGPATGTSSRWRKNKEHKFVISLYLAQHSVGLYIRGFRGVADATVYEMLLPFAERLSRETGAEFGSPEPGYFFTRSYEANTSDKSRWDELADWLYATANQYERALQMIGE